MIAELLGSFDHPKLLLVATVLCIPALWPITRFIFEDFETFKAEAGLRTEFDRKLWLLGCLPGNPYFYFKLICLVGGYVAVLSAMYQVLIRLF